MSSNQQRAANHFRTYHRKLVVHREPAEAGPDLMMAKEAPKAAMPEDEVMLLPLMEVDLHPLTHKMTHKTHNAATTNAATSSARQRKY